MNEIRRGHLKYYVLRLLSEGHKTGYGLMKAIETETWLLEAVRRIALFRCWRPVRAAELIAEVEEPDGSVRWADHRCRPSGLRRGHPTASARLFDSMRRSRRRLLQGV